MPDEYKIIDTWNLKDRKRLDRDSIDLLYEKLLADINRLIEGNIHLHNQKVKKGVAIRADFIPQLLKHLQKDLKVNLDWRFYGKGGD